MASQLSGLSTHVIRIWERRYGAMNPTRTDTNRRMFCEEAIRRLKLLRELTENGHRIGNVAQRPTDELQKLVDQQLQQTVSASACASTDTTLSGAVVSLGAVLAASGPPFPGRRSVCPVSPDPVSRTSEMRFEGPIFVST